MAYIYDDAMTWKYTFGITGPFWGEPLVDSHHKEPVVLSFGVFIIVIMKKLLNNSQAAQNPMSWYSCDVIPVTN